MRRRHPSRLQITAEILHGVSDQWRLPGVRVPPPRNRDGRGPPVHNPRAGRGLGERGRVRGLVEDDVGVLGVGDGEGGGPAGLSALAAGRARVEAGVASTEV